MIKKGDMISIALIMANVVFVCLLVAKGSFIAQDMAAGNNSDNASLPNTIIPDITLTATARPSPTITLAVNEGALLFAEIRSQPRQESSTPTLTPTPTPTSTPTTKDGDIEQGDKRSYRSAADYTPGAKAVPSYRKVSKARSQHH